MSAKMHAPAKAAPTSSFTLAASGLLQRKCACGGTAGLDGECAECRKKRLQRRESNHAEPATVPRIVHDVLNSPGRPLDAATLAFMEPRFEYDFSRVRVHTDAKAAESAQAVQARAYTLGDDVVFAEGQYAPATAGGTRLLAHELTHVVQQRGHNISVQAQLRIGDPGHQCEEEAKFLADSVLTEGSKFHQNPDGVAGPVRMLSSGPDIMHQRSAGQRPLAHQLTHVLQQNRDVTHVKKFISVPAIQRTTVTVEEGCPGTHAEVVAAVGTAWAGMGRIADAEAKECLREELDDADVVCEPSDVCGSTRYVGSTITVSKWGAGCPSLPALLVHEAAHKCKLFFTEEFAEACENEAFGGRGATPPGPDEAGGTCEL